MRRERWHPWRTAAALGLDVYVQRLPDDAMGWWDPDGATVYIDSRCTQAERRSTLAHELVHAERGDEPCATGWHEHKQERAVDAEAARRLIPLGDLVDALLWSRDEHELAWELWVDVAMVRARLQSLTPNEVQDIEERLEAAERGAA
jgi:hypothetical protein